ncbi:MAG: DUF2000 domain-containing protein [Bacteroides sp.]|nr:DUF2000 domain-containing protein [Eubacterium sp.]MCM1418002.1 DUF2000 domain-containing protein [Roseburia sp.]MCM1462175.1 DUF2000 domain-containing protein [Bacteroides sp.]
MESEKKKCVLVIDRALPLGFIANTAAILAFTLGKRAPDAVGEDVSDKSGFIHSGIVRLPIPILQGDCETLRTLRERLFLAEYGDLAVVDFTETAQGSKTYPEWIEKMSVREEKELSYLGIAIYGDAKKVGRLTGNLPLLK